MKRFYSQYRIMLLTFTLGLASVWMIDGLSKGLLEVPADLPKVKTDNVIVVFPRYSKEMPQQGGGDGGGGCGWENQIITKATNPRKSKR
jgi:hypothetical protein